MQVEYRKWSTNKTFEKAVYALVSRNEKVVYEIRNCLSRLFLSWHNFPSKREEIWKRFLREVSGKGVQDSSKIPPLKEGRGIANIPLPEIWVNNGRAIVKYGSFRFTIPSHRYEKWKEMKISQNNIVAMLLRYDSIVCENGNFWSLDPKICEVLSNNYGASLEGFSSPLNNNFGNFCSLFPDVDSNFGSIGNFFDVIPTLSSGVYMANPPFIEDVMNAASSAVLSLLSSKEDITFFLYMPKWDDCRGIKELQESKYLVDCFPLPKGKHQAYDHIKDSYLTAYFDGFLFVVSSSSTPYGEDGRDPLVKRIEEVAS